MTMVYQYSVCSTAEYVQYVELEFLKVMKAADKNAIIMVSRQCDTVFLFLDEQLLVR